jgi:hypothetical protein
MRKLAALPTDEHELAGLFRTLQLNHEVLNMIDKKEVAPKADEAAATMKHMYSKTGGGDLSALRAAQVANTTKTRETPNHSNRSSDYRGRRK